MQNRMMITGSGSGLGREIALRWAREGWQLALSDVSEPGLQETLKLVREAGGDGFVQRCDVRDYSQLTAFAQACEVKLGGIDVIVNNAGVASGGFFAELSLEDWDWQIAINLMGVVKGCKAFLPLLEKSRGRIINIASVHGLVGSTGKAAYVAAKHGVIGLTKVVGLETATSNVTCNAICPGWVLTPLVQQQIDDRAAKGVDPQQAQHDLLAEKQPSLAFVTPPQLGELVLFLCSEAGAQVRGAAWNIDGGWLAQ